MSIDRTKYLTEPEYRRLIYAARTRPHKNALRDRALLETAGMAGLRVGEAIGIRVGDFRYDPSGSLLGVVPEKKRDRGPGLPIVEVGLPKSAARTLARYISSLPKDRRRSWCRIFPMTRQQARNIFKQYAKLAGLDPRYSFHALRHFRGVQLYEKTRDPKLVQRALRHANLASTEVYIHIVDAQKRIAAADVEHDGEEERE